MRDVDLRTGLVRRLIRRHSHEPNARILHELGLRHGKARVDIAVVNGALHGYELKSDNDTLERLVRQEQIYSTVLDRVTLVVGERHSRKAISMVPEWWGVQVVKMGPRGGMNFYSARRARNNPSQDPIAIAKLLWRDEALELLSRLGAAEGLRSKPRAMIYARLAKVAGLEEIRSTVRHRLRNRAGLRSGEPLELDDG